MIGVAIKGLLGRKLRAVLTGFAIVLGVAMISGAFVLTDTLGKSFDGIFNESYKATDAVISSKAAVGSSTSNDKAPAFSADVLKDVQALPGVRVAQGSIEDHARLVNSDGDAIGSADEGVAFGIPASADQSLNPIKLVTGQWPRGDGQIAVDKSTADKQHFTVGQTVGAFGEGPVEQYRISGIVRFGSVGSIGKTTITVFDLPTAQSLFNKLGKLDVIRVGAKPGVSDAQLVREITPLLSTTTQVKSAADQAAADSSETQDGLNIIKYALLGFAGIALFVGSFVIANTLAITVAQRMRELATLRTLGASRRQVLGSVILESVIVGLLGSIIGLFLGVGIAVGLTALLKATGVDLPEHSLVFSMRTVVVSLGVGTLISLLASLRPAVRATRIEPIAAVREGAVMPASRFARYAVPTSAIVGAASIALFSYGVFASGVEIKPDDPARHRRAADVRRRRDDRDPDRPAAGVRAGSSGSPLRRLGRQAGPRERGAQPGANGVHGRRRHDRPRADHVRRGDRPGLQELVHRCRQHALHRRLLGLGRRQRRPAHEQGRRCRGDRARRHGGVADALRRGQGRRQDRLRHRSRRERDEGHRRHMDEGLGHRSRTARHDGAFVLDQYADDHSLTMGSPLAIETPAGKTIHVHITGIVDPPKGGSPFGEISVSKATFDASFANHDNEFTFVNIQGGPSEANTAALKTSLAAFPAAVVETRDEFRTSRTRDITQTLQILYALLGLSVIVSLFGVINTLVLSVFERTRELGMLRAIGMTRRQIRRMIRHESIVTALIGATLGIGVGMFLAFSRRRRSRSTASSSPCRTSRSSCSSESRSSPECWRRSCRRGGPRG